MDIALDILDIGTGFVDLAISAGDLVTEDGLRTAVILSLFTDGRANEDDVLPLGETSRRGTWFDGVTDDAGDRYGSREWLLGREKETDQVRNQMIEMTEEALAWLVEDGVAARVAVDAEWVGGGRLERQIDITRPDGSLASFRFGDLWAEEQDKGSANAV